MIDNLRALAVFATTVETGSFRAAAKALGLSPSVVSHHIGQLEARLGTALLYRSTRRLSLTPDGATLFEHAQAMRKSAEAGLNVLAYRAAEPSGTLSVSLPAFMARSALTTHLAAFAQRYPGITLNLDYSDLKRDLIADGIDLAIRIGALQDSALKSRRLFDMPRKLVVAPSVAAQHPRPQRPEDLRDWDWIGVQMRPDYKLLRHADGETCKLGYTPRIVVNSIEAFTQMALHGLGLATPPAFLVEEALASGALVEPLPEWTVESLGVYAVWPPNAAREGLTFRLLEFLVERIADGEVGR